MNQTRPLVSIGLPVYNGQNYVADAIQCVMRQTYPNWELIISDNASTDRTASICAEFAASDNRIRVYQNNRNLGFALNYNRVFELSRGRYFKWVAHDDLFESEFVERCIEELEASEDAVLAFPKLVHVDASGRPLQRQAFDLSVCGSTAESRVLQLIDLAIPNTDIFWSQFGLIRRSVLAQTRLMALYSGSDQVMLLELALRGQFKQVEKELFFRRKHPAASTMRRGWNAKERARFAYADDRRILVLPICRLLKEHLLCILNSSISPSGKLRCAAALARRFRAHWKDIVLEVVGCPLEALR